MFTEDVQDSKMEYCTVCLREKSMYLDKEDVVQVKDAFKWAVQGLVGKELGATVLTNVSFPLTLANRGILKADWSWCKYIF